MVVLPCIFMPRYAHAQARYTVVCVGFFLQPIAVRYTVSIYNATLYIVVR